MEGTSPPTRPSSSRRKLSLVLILLGGLGLVVGALLLTDCQALTGGVPCSSATSNTCLPSGNCPLAPVGVIVLSLSFLVLIAGIILRLGKRPEGEVPHPERPTRPRVPDTALTRMERERAQREKARRERDD